MDSVLHLDPHQLAPEAGNPRVASVMRDEVVFCLPSTPIDAIAKLLADNMLTEIPVLLDRRPVGYIVDTDILDCFVRGEIIAGGSDFAVRPPTTEVQARHIMRTPPLVVDENQLVLEAAEIMAQQHRSLALVMHEDTTAVGMLTPTEIADFALRTATRELQHA